MIDLVEAKKRYRTVFGLELAGNLIYFRLPTWRENSIYKQVFSITPRLLGHLEDELFRSVCLDPQVVDRMNSLPAGVITTIVGLAIKLSGNDLLSPADADRINSDLNQIRTNLDNNPHEYLILTICKAFPSMTPREVEDLPYSEVLRMVVIAERKLELEPIIFGKKKKEKSFTDQIFEDASRAQSLDIDQSRGTPSPAEIRDALLQNRGESVNLRQAQQQEMIRKVKERRRQG